MEYNTKNLEQSPNEIVQIQEKDKICFEFENITYIHNRFNFNKLRFEKKEVLQGVSGCFKSGELTFIIGPSGAGKTTLLNVLAGYTTIGARGTIRINGVSMSASKSSNRGGTKYILQKDNMRSCLTTYESMYYAAALKRVDLTSKERHKKVIEILNDLNMCESQKTRVGNLSGGEKRRLAVSLELLSDPRLLFLDEPTTGLDASASTSLVVLLNKLAKGGRTIVATIQQPSAMLLEKINTVYCLANGKTLYDGPRKNLVPAFNHAELHCPSHYNPADFLIEIATTESQSRIDKAAGAMRQYNNETATEDRICSPTSKYFKTEKNTTKKVQNEASNFMQTLILIRRTYMIAARSYQSLLLRLFSYLIIGFLTGKVYYMAGSDAATVIGNGSSIYSIVMFVVYAALMFVTLSSQVEIEMVKGEHFNQWYNVGPYMISFLSLEFPFQALLTAMCSAICYWLTGNPVEWDRMTFYVTAIVLSSVCAQAWGFFLGSTVPIKIAVFIGPTLTSVYSLFAFSLPLKITPYPFRWLYHISYFRAACHIAINGIYGNRSKLPCSKEYCHYVSPKEFLKEFGLETIDITTEFTLIVATTVMLYALTYCTIYYRLNKR